MGIFDKVLPDIKGRVTAFILEYLGQYLDGLDKKQVKLKLWQGDLVIHNVRLKAEAVDGLLQDGLGMPWALMWGNVTSLHLKVPWSSLKKESVVVTLEGVKGLVLPLKGKKWSGVEVAQRRKQANLAAWEASRISDQTTSTSSGWIAKLKGAILENLKIVVNNVHLRYEDCISQPYTGKAMGVTMRSVGLATTGKDWAEKFQLNPEDPRIYRLLHVQDLSFYIIPVLPVNDCTSSPRNRAILAQGHGVVNFDKPDESSVVLQPVTCGVRIDMQRYRGSLPPVASSVHLSSIDLSFTREQYSALIDVAMEVKHGFEPYQLSVRPPPFCRPTLGRNPDVQRRRQNTGYTADAAAWWRYAICSVMSGTDPTETDYPAPSPLPVDIERYEVLHSKLISDDPLSEADQASYDMLQTCLPLATIKACRASVYNRSKTTSPKKGGTLLSWRNKRQQNPTPSPTPDDSKADTDKEETDELPIDANAVLWQLTLTMTGCSLTLTGVESLGDVKGAFNNFELTTAGRERGVKADISLHSFEVKIPSRDAVFPHLVQSNNANNMPLLKLRVEQRPADRPELDLAVHSDLAPMTFFCDPQALFSLKEFLIPPMRSELRLVKNLGRTALKYAKAELKEVNKKHWALSTDIVAPNLILMDDTTSEMAPMVLVSCGRLVLSDTSMLQPSHVTSDTFLLNFDSAYITVGHIKDYLTKSPSKRYLLKPVAIQGTARRAHVPKPSTPYVTVECICEEVEVAASLKDVRVVGLLCKAFERTAVEEKESESWDETLADQSMTTSLKIAPAPVLTNKLTFTLKSVVVRVEDETVPCIVSASGTVITATLSDSRSHIAVDTSDIHATTALVEDNVTFIKTSYGAGAGTGVPVGIVILKEDFQPVSIVCRFDLLDVAVGNPLVHCVEFIWRSLNEFDKATREAPAVMEVLNRGAPEAVVKIMMKQARLLVLDEDRDRLLIAGIGANVTITSYTVGMNVETYLEEAELRDLYQPLATQQVVSYNNPSNPLTIKVDTPGDDGTHSTWAALLSIEAWQPCIVFYFPQFDAMLDFFKAGHVHRLLCVSDMFLHSPPPPSGPPKVSLKLHDPLAYLPEEPSQLGSLKVHLGSLVLNTDMRFETNTADESVVWNEIFMNYTGIRILSDTTPNVLQETSFELVISSLLSIEGEPQKAAGLRVKLHAPSLSINLTQADYVAVLSVFCLNLLGVPPVVTTHHEPKDIDLCFEDINIQLPAHRINGKQLHPHIKSDTYGDKQVDVTLHALSIVNSTNKPLLECGSDAKAQDDFFAVSIRTESSEIKQGDVSLNTLLFTVLPDAWSELLCFFNNTESVNVMSSVTTHSKAIQNAKQQVSEGTVLNFNIARVSAMLLAVDSTDLMLCSAHDLLLKFEKTTTSTTINTSLARLCATDARTAQEDDRYIQVLDTAGSEKLVSFQVTNYHGVGSHTDYVPPGTTVRHSSDVEGRIGGFCVVYKHRFWDEVASLVLNSPIHSLMEKGKESAARAATQSVQKGTVSKIDISWDNPTVVIPAALDSAHCLNLQLERLAVNSSIREQDGRILDCIDVEFTSLSLMCNQEKRAVLLKDTTGLVAVSRVVVICDETPDLMLKTSLPSFALHLSPNAWLFIKDVVQKNINELNIPSSPLYPMQEDQVSVRSSFEDEEEEAAGTISIDASCPALCVIFEANNGEETVSMSMENIQTRVQNQRGSGQTDATIEVAVLAVKDLQGEGEATHILKPADGSKATFVTQVWSVPPSKPRVEVILAPLVLHVFPKRLNELLQLIPREPDEALPLIQSPSFSRNESFLRPHLSTKHGMLTMKLTHIDINLLETMVSTLARVKVGECKLQCLQANGHMSVMGNLGNVQVHDEETSLEVLGLAKPEEGSVISFTYESIKSRMYTHKLSCTLHSVRFLFLLPFVQKLQSVVEGHVAEAVKETQTIISHEARAAAVSAMCLSLRVEHPVLIIPNRPDATSHLTIDLGLMTLENHLEDEGDCLVAAVDDCLISCAMNGDEVHMLESPLHARGSGKRNIYHSSIEATTDISPMAVKLSQDVWQECVTILSHNFLQVPGKWGKPQAVQQPVNDETPLSFKCSFKCPVVSVTVAVPVDLSPPLILRSSAHGVSGCWDSMATEGRFEVNMVTTTGGIEGDAPDEMLHASSLVATTKTAHAVGETVTNVQLAAAANFSISPSTWLNVTDFVIAPFERVSRGLPANMKQVTIITISDNTTLTSDLELGEHTMLLIKSDKNTVTIKGGGYNVNLVKMQDKKRQPIHIEDGVVLVVLQCVFKLSHESSLHEYVSLGGPSAGLMADPLRNKFEVYENPKQEKEEDVSDELTQRSGRVVKLTTDLTLRGKLSDGDRGLMLAVDLHGDGSKRQAVDGSTLQTFGSVMISKLEVSREDNSAYLVERLRLDAFIKGKAAVSAIEIISSNISVRVAHSDMVFIARIIAALGAGSTTRPFVKARRRKNIEMEVQVPVVGVCIIDDSQNDVNLPLFEVKIRDIAFNFAVFHLRTSFHILVNHYNQHGCEWEPVLDEAPVGIDYNFVEEASAKVTITAARGLDLVMSASYLQSVKRAVSLWDTTKHSELLQCPTTDTSSFSADPQQKYPTRIDNTLPCAIQYTQGKKGLTSTIDAMGKASSMSASSIGISTPYDDVVYTINTSRLGLSVLSCGVVADLKLDGGVKVISVKTSVSVHNALQIPVVLGELGTLPSGGCLSVPDHMLDKKMKVYHDPNTTEAAIPSLPYSELVHSCLTRGGSIEVPLLAPDADNYFVVTVDRDDVTDRTELKICPPFSVTNLTGRAMSVEFYSDTAGAALASTLLETSQAVHLTTVDPTQSLYMSTSFVQPGGENLASTERTCIKTRDRTEHHVINTRLLGETSNVLPVWVDTTYLSRREAHLTSRFWIVNHTLFNLTLDCCGASVELPGKADSPVLVSPRLLGEQKLEVTLQITGTDAVSEELQLHILGAEGLAYLTDPQKEGHSLAIAYRTAFSRGEQGYRTRVVELLPRWVIFNKTSFSMDLISSSGVVELPPNTPVPYHSQQTGVLSQFVCFGAGAEKSCSVCLNQVGDVVLHVVQKDGKKVHIRVSIKEDTTLYVLIVPTIAPFLVVNRTPYILKFWQTGHEGTAVDVKQRETAPLCWEDVSGKQTIQFEAGGVVTAPIDVFGLGGRQEAVVSLPASDVYCHLSPTKDDRVLELIAYTDPLMGEQVLKLAASQSDISVLNTKIDVKHLSVSLVRQEERREVACLTLHGLFTQVYRGNGQEMIQLNLQRLQLDDMSESQPLFPVVVSILDNKEDRPALHFTSLRRLNNSNLLHYQHVGLEVDPIKVSIGDRFLWEFFEFRREVNVALGLRYAQATCYSTEHYTEKCVVESGILARRIYFDALTFGEIHFTLTVDRLKEGRDPYRDGLGLGNLALALPSVKDSEVTLDKVAVNHGRDNVGMLLHRLATNYARQFEASHNLAGMVGRIQAIGNPLGLFSNITTGVRDFVVLPAMGLSRSPVEFGTGILKGTGSLVGKSVGGIFGTVAGVTRGSARAIESVADQDWRTRRAVDAKAEKNNPLETAVKGVFDGVVGLLKDPIVGALHGGAMGGLKGAGQGLVGAVAKPVSGVLNGVSDAASLIEKTVMLKSSLARVRDPKYYDPERQSAGIVWKETYENQRWYIGVGWSNGMLPFVDRTNWSDQRGKKTEPKSRIQLPKGMVWASSWTTDATNGGKDGWLYAVDFKSAFHKHRHELDFVRRRRWLRAMRPAADAVDEPITETSPRSGTKSSFIALERRVAAKLANRLKQKSDVSPRSAKPGPVSLSLIEVTENQKYLHGTGWSSDLGLMDCWKWSDKSGREKKPVKTVIKPPVGYKWCSEWETEGGDDHGWWYADYFDSAYNVEVQPTSSFRKRHWRREARIIV
eukprot:TRINITY_DN4605_c0_g2_i1.p1 TRINITY_DN4605_c0_g2~~TRINITY_DN4605_c0_g2_i1.p1  ORF type:complete len:3886 (+),score=834.56 TRINITY_DN4605_c0_g2_i1:82-11739(+)